MIMLRLTPAEPHISQRLCLLHIQQSKNTPKNSVFLDHMTDLNQKLNINSDFNNRLIEYFIIGPSCNITISPSCKNRATLK